MKRTLAMMAVGAGKVALVATVGAALPVLADDVLDTSEAAVFAYNAVDESPFGLAAAGALPAVTYQSFETVTTTAPDGTVVTNVADAAERGSYTFTPTVGGVWTLSNSMSGTVKVCVPWSINGDSTNVTSAATAYVVDLEQEGPNRKTHRRDTLPLVAYSGDDWVGDLAKAATVTIAPPSGSGLETTTWSDLAAGNGARSFAFNVAGRWTVTLTFADSTTRSAIIDVRNSGFIIRVR
jgi:hypothetical protein